MTETGSSYLIDTDWLIDYLAGRRKAVELFSRLDSTRRAISIVTFGEVFEGIYFGGRAEEHESLFRGLLPWLVVLGISEQVAQRFGRIRGELRRTGMLIPDADLLIAATALHYDLTLVTRNRRHFERVPGIRLYPA